jgi:hypothetical protein
MNDKIVTHKIEDFDDGVTRCGVNVKASKVMVAVAYNVKFVNCVDCLELLARDHEC